MRMSTWMIVFLTVAIAAIGCTQPDPVQAEYEPADCECADDDEARDESASTDDEADDEADDELTSTVRTDETEPDADREADELTAEDDDSSEQKAEKGDEESSGDSTREADGAGGQRIDLNEASSVELMELPGVGPALADRIIEFRKKRPFEKPEHLLRVKGIGEATYGDLAPMIAVE